MTVPERRSSSDPLFEQASREVLRYLREHVPLAFWAVTRVENGRQTYLAVEDSGYGLQAGQFHRWSDSFCISMVAGVTPAVAPDAQQVPEYAAAGVNRALVIGGYAGSPILDADGSLFGAICGLDPAVQPAALAEVEPLLVLLSRLLTVALVADRQAKAAVLELLEARLAADVDALTGLLTRHAWERLVDVEAQSFTRLADPTGVVIIDLNGLKPLNDTEGHAAGDALLALAGAAIRAAVRADDPVARLGGDEFGVLLRDCSAESAQERAEQIRQSLDAAGVDAAVGAAAAAPGSGLPGAVAAADEAMYEEKRRLARSREDGR